MVSFLVGIFQHRKVCARNPKVSLNLPIIGQAMSVINIFTVFFQGTPIKDVTISADAPTTLLLDKHIKYIEAYGSKKDDFVSGLLKCFQIFS